MKVHEALPGDIGDETSLIPYFSCQSGFRWMGKNPPTTVDGPTYD